MPGSPGGPPDANYMAAATDSMNQTIAEKYGESASVDNIGDFSPELHDLIQEFYAAPNYEVADAIFQQIQMTLSGAEPTSAAPKQVDSSSINDIIEQFIQQHGFSGSVMVVQNGSPIFANGYGEATAGIDNSSNTTYRWDSVSKLITTTAVLQLTEKMPPLLNLNAPITTYLPEYANPQQYPGFAGQPPVTLLSLLSMTSGITNIPSPQPGWEVPPTFKNIIDSIAEQPRTDIGTWQYSNSSFNLIAMIIGRVTNPAIDPSVAFGNYLQQHIFDRAGMSSASAPSTVAEDTPEAQGHIYDDSGNPLEYGTNQWPDYTSMRIGAGNVNGSVWDFEKFNAALNSGQLISMKDVALMQDERLGGWDPGQHTINGVSFLAKGGAQDGEQSYFMQLPNNTMIFITANIDPKDPNNGQDHIQYLGAEIMNLLTEIST